MSKRFVRLNVYRVVRSVEASCSSMQDVAASQITRTLLTSKFNHQARPLQLPDNHQ